MERYERALNWRKKVLGWSRRELSEKTGYSVTSIQNFEQGFRPYSTPISEAQWRKYSMAVASASIGIRFDFDRLFLGECGPEVRPSPIHSAQQNTRPNNPARA